MSATDQCSGEREDLRGVALSGSPAQERRRKATAREIDDRIEAVAELLACRQRKSQIKAYCRENYGIGARQCEEYLARAREWLRKGAAKPKEDLLAEAIGLLEAVIRDPLATHRARIDAQREIALIFGLYPVRRLRHDCAGSEDASMIEDRIKQLSNEELEYLASIHHKLNQMV